MILPPLVAATGELSVDDFARYSRQLVLPEFGVTGQRRVAAAKVLVIGAGGLGSPVLLYLAAAGVGTIGIVDSDLVELSNLHRQVVHATASVGASKVDSAGDAVTALNPSVTVRRHQVRLDATDADRLIAQYDLVIDGSDNFPTRYLVNDACVRAGKPLVWGSVLGFAAQVAVFWAAAPGGRGVELRDVFPEAPAPGTVQSCAEGGVIGAVCAQAGSVMAMEAIKLITGTGRPLLGRILVIDALGGRWDEVAVRRSPAPPATATSVPRDSLDPSQSPVEEEVARRASDKTSHPHRDHQPPSQIGLPARDGTILLDVRTPDEFADDPIPGSVNVPLPALLSGDDEGLPTDSAILVICRTGARAEVAAQSLIARGFGDVRVLNGGLDALAEPRPAPKVPRDVHDRTARDR